MNVLGRFSQVMLVFGILLTLLVAVGLGAAYATLMPGRSYEGPLPPLTDEETRLAGALRANVVKLADEIGPRSQREPEALDAAAEYIETVFRQAALAGRIERHEYISFGRPVWNIILELPGRSRGHEIVVVGAHYDSVPGCPAANDNGSGVAGLLELARLLSGRALERTVRFVAFTNEEPPHFHTDSMGSLVYARRCRERGDQIVAMLSLEMLGYFSDAPGSQHYPWPLGLIYPDRGDFIAFVGNLRSAGLVREVVASFRRHAAFPSQGGAVPEFIEGMGWSDHWSFWRCGYPAVMVTDTSLFRYPYYHRVTDTPDKLDYERCARVTAGLARVVVELAGGEASE